MVRESVAAAVEYEEAAEKKVASVMKAAAKQARQEQTRKEEAEKEAARREEQKRLESIHKEQASLALARRSLLHYVERRNPNYDASWAHEHVANQLELFYEAVARKESPRLILTLPSRFGKAVAHICSVVCLDPGTGELSFKQHGDLQPGDRVFGSDGLPTRVVACSDEMPMNMRVRFSNGEAITCHENHEWVVFDRGQQVWRTMETKQLYYTRSGNPRKILAYEKASTSGRSVYQVAPTPRLITPDIKLPIDPYVLGAWLGDGSSNGPSFTHHPSEIQVIQEIERRGYEKVSSVHYFSAGSCRTGFVCKRDDPRSLMYPLKRLNLIYNKHIPECMLNAGTRQRLELLAGLIDTDGTTDKSGRISFTTVSPRLRDDYMTLVRSLGWSPYYTTVQPSLSTSGIQGQHEYYQVGFQPDADIIPIMLTHKRPQRVVPRQKVGIVAVEYIDTPEPGKCIQVANADGIYLVGEQMVPTHNSMLASDSGPAWALGHHPDWNFVIASYSDELPCDFSYSIREQLRSPEYRKLFPNGAHVNKDDSSVKAWSTVEGGGLRATGVGGGLLGFGADVITIDDPLKDMEQADSPGILDKVFDWFTSICYSRLLPGGGIVIILQRMSVDDLAGKLIRRMEEEKQRLQELLRDAAELESKSGATQEELEDARLLKEEAEELHESMDRWVVLEYPALAAANEYLNQDTGEIIRVSNGVTVDPSYRKLRSIGEALHPKRYNRSYLLKLKRGNPRRFAAMYALNPVSDEGAYFNESDFKRYKPGQYPKPANAHTFCAWDNALGTKQSNDWTVGLAGRLDCKGNLYLLERVRGKFGDVREVSDLVIDLHQRWGAQITGIEKSHISMAMGPILKSRMAERSAYIVLAEGKEALIPTTDKKIRARTFQGLCRSGKVYVPEGEDWDHYITLMTRFGASQIDDDVDASAWLGILATRNPPPKDPSKERNPIRIVKNAYDKLFEMYDNHSGGGSGFMES